MQEIRHDGTEVLTPSVTMKQVGKAIRNPANREVRVHMPGSIIDTVQDGHRKKFRVNEDGSLTRVHLTTLEPLSDV